LHFASPRNYVREHRKTNNPFRVYCVVVSSLRLFLFHRKQRAVVSPHISHYNPKHEVNLFYCLLSFTFLIRSYFLNLLSQVNRFLRDLSCFKLGTVAIIESCTNVQIKIYRNKQKLVDNKIQNYFSLV
jgi:hypothetical protein